MQQGEELCRSCMTCAMEKISFHASFLVRQAQVSQPRTESNPTQGEFYSSIKFRCVTSLMSFVFYRALFFEVTHREFHARGAKFASRYIGTRVRTCTYLHVGTRSGICMQSREIWCSFSASEDCYCFVHPSRFRFFHKRKQTKIGDGKRKASQPTLSILHKPRPQNGYAHAAARRD